VVNNFYSFDTADLSCQRAVTLTEFVRFVLRRPTITVTTKNASASFIRELGVLHFVFSEYLVANSDVKSTNWDADLRNADLSYSGRFGEDVIMVGLIDEFVNAAWQNYSLADTFSMEEKQNSEKCDYALSSTITAEQFVNILTKFGAGTIWSGDEMYHLAVNFSDEEMSAYEARVPEKVNTGHETCHVRWPDFLTWILFFEGLDSARNIIKARITHMLNCGPQLTAEEVSGTESYHVDAGSGSSSDDIDVIWDVSTERSVFAGTLVDTYLCARAIKRQGQKVTTEAEIAGHYIYSHRVGTVLCAGLHTLSVYFFPFEFPARVNGDSITGEPLAYAKGKSVELLVIKARPTIIWNGVADACILDTVRPTLSLPTMTIFERLTSARHLNGVAVTGENSSIVLSGRFFFSVTAGNFFSDPGEYIVEATFIPNETEIYEVVTAKRLIVVRAPSDTPDCNCLMSDERIEPYIRFHPWPLKPFPYGETILTHNSFSYEAVDPVGGNTVIGEFAFSPGLDKILAVGIHTLMMTFTPNSEGGTLTSRTYKPVSLNIDITVVKGRPKIIWETVSIGRDYIYTNESIDTLIAKAALCAGCLDKCGQLIYSVPLSHIFVQQGHYTVTATYVPSEEYSIYYSQTVVDITIVVTDPPHLRLVWGLAGATGLYENIDVLELEYGTPVSANNLRLYAYLLAPDDSTSGGDESGPLDGTVEYTCDTNAILEVGNHRITAIFTPTARLLVAATAVLMIRVIPRRLRIEWLPKLEDGIISVCDAGESSVSVEVFVGKVVTVQFLCGRAKYAHTSSLPYEEPISDPHGQFVYSCTLGHKFSVPGNQRIDAVFIPVDTKNNTITSKTMHVHVLEKRGPILKWNIADTKLISEVSSQGAPQAVEIVYGTILTAEMISAAVTLAFNDSSGLQNVDESTNVDVEPPEGFLIYEPAHGTLLDVGWHEYSCQFIPADPFSTEGTRITIKVKVRRATPSLSWCGYRTGTTTLDALDVVTLPSIHVGEELTLQTHLCCVCTYPASIQGSFVYSPPPGFSFAHPGEYDIQVIFLPDFPFDNNFKHVQMKANILVTAATTETDVNAIQKKRTGCISQCMLIWNSPPAIDYGTPLTEANVLTARCIRSWDFEEVPGEYVYFPDSGTVLNAGKQPVMVRFIPSSNSAFSEAMHMTIEIYVVKRKPLIEWPSLISETNNTPMLTDAAFNVGQSYTMGRSSQVTTSCDGSTFYSVVNTDSGVLTFTRPGPTEIMTLFVPDNPINYEPCWNFTPVLVRPQPKPAETKLVWAPMPRALVFGQPLGTAECSAVALINSGSGSNNNKRRETLYTPGGVITYDPIPGTLLDAGWHTLTANFRPTDPTVISGCSATARLNVVKATPTLRWKSFIYESVLTIAVGDELTDLQIAVDCVEGISGEYVYSKPPGFVVLEPGEYSVEARFIPEDVRNYHLAFLNRKFIVRHPTKEALRFIAYWCQHKNGDPSLEYGSELRASLFELSCVSIRSGAVVSGQYLFQPPLGTRLAVGRHEVTIQFVPDNQTRYDADGLTAVLSVTVDKYRPEIRWQPQEIFFVGNNNQILTDATLNATIAQPQHLSLEVLGSLIYRPALGHIFDEDGEHTLTATFVPNLSLKDDVEAVGKTVTVYSLRNKPKVLVTVAYDDARDHRAALGPTASSQLMAREIYDSALSSPQINLDVGDRSTAAVEVNPNYAVQLMIDPNNPARHGHNVDISARSIPLQHVSLSPVRWRSDDKLENLFEVLSDVEGSRHERKLPHLPEVIVEHSDIQRPQTPRQLLPRRQSNHPSTLLVSEVRTAPKLAMYTGLESTAAAQFEKLKENEESSGTEPPSTPRGFRYHEEAFMRIATTASAQAVHSRGAVADRHMSLAVSSGPDVQAGQEKHQKRQSSIHISTDSPLRPNEWLPAGNAAHNDHEDDVDARIIPVNRSRDSDLDQVKVAVQSVRLSSILLSSSDCEQCEVKIKYGSEEFFGEPLNLQPGSKYDTIPNNMKEFAFQTCSFCMKKDFVRREHLTLSIRGNTNLSNDGKLVEFYAKVALPLGQVKLVRGEVVSLSVAAVPKIYPVDTRVSIEKASILNSCVFTVWVELCASQLLEPANTVSLAVWGAAVPEDDPPSAAVALSKRKTTVAAATSRPSFVHPQRRLTISDRSYRKGAAII
jgi:hypothetical protein